MLPLLILASYALGALGGSPPVSVSLRSSFASTDPLLEALETVAVEDPSTLFPILSHFPLPERPSTPRDAYETVLGLASTYLDVSALASARARLALHAATPHLAASAEHYDLRVANVSDTTTLLREECASWVDWYGHIVCDTDTLLQFAANTALAKNPDIRRFPFDHVYSVRPRLDEPRRTAIHYADPTAPSFAPLHDALLSLQPNTEYVIRWAKGTSETMPGELSSYLSGYGVALDLKKMDYLVLDDRYQGGSAGSSNTVGSSGGHADNKDKRVSDEVILSCIFESLPYVDEHAEARAKAGEPLSSDEIADLGIKATQFLASFSSQPHEHSCWDNQPIPIDAVFRTLSTSFPLYATSLARKVHVSDELRDEIYENWAKATPGTNMVWVNGRVLNEDQGASGDIFGILRTLRRERALVNSLVGLGLTQDQVIELLMHPEYSSSSTGGPPSASLSKRGTMADSVKESDFHKAEGQQRKSFTLPPKFAEFLEGLVDASDRREGGGVILWLNDLEKDPRYGRFGSSLMGLLRVHSMGLFSPALPLQHNLMNVVFILDLSQLYSLSVISSLQENFVVRGYPVRWGFVPETRGESLNMARILYYVERTYGRDTMIRWIRGVLATHGQRRVAALSWSIVDELFDTLNAPDDFISVTGGNVPVVDETSGESLLSRAQEYCKRLGVGTREEAGKGHVFVNGRYLPVSDNVMRQIATEGTAQLQILQEMVYVGEINDSDAPLMSTWFYDLPSTMSRRNPYIFTTNTGGRTPDARRGPELFDLVDLFYNVGLTLKDGSFAIPHGSQNSVLPLTMYVIADLDTQEGVKLAAQALKFISNPAETRVTFMHNPATLGQESSSPASQLLITAVQTGTLSAVCPRRILAALIDEKDESGLRVLQDELLSGTDMGDTETTGLSLSMHLLARHLGLQPGERAILVNGRLVGPFDSNAEFLSEDFEMLESYEITKRVGRIIHALDGALEEEEDFIDVSKRSNLISVASSIIYADQQPDPSEAGLFDTSPKPRTGNYRLLSGNYTKFEFGDRSTARTHVGLLLDPLSEAAQKWSSVLEHHSSLFPEAFIELYFNPVQHSDIPLKRFYRYNVVPALHFDENGQEIPAQVTFTALPEEPIYTLGMDVAQSWLVRPRNALYDLDNIQLGMLQGEERSRGIQALFALDYLVIEGHARELRSNNPPRGVQLQLVGTKDGSVTDDTQVVANLGYLQFKGRPGTFRLEIREGRGRAIYALDSVGAEGWNSPSVAEAGDEFTVMNFDGLTLYPRVAHRPGMEGMDVLDDMQPVEEPSGIVDGLISKVASLFKPTKAGETGVLLKEVKQADINIFTRFASIMILSVLRNTQSTVKFWFIENFLSPSFLEFIPHMAEEYGFQYELVTYKWPSWLRPQKEKQRIIWAYKILFLDVLFPMDLKKVIFVDADQIVRADLKELVDLDLHGAPYGYVPMGDDNYEMEGYRFWKTGYWRDFLAGRPYHISALYVVDLVRFRQMAAGDILRGQYQMLSADPNSLANLDQDLPNNLQREVPIYSLHEDWLWCETWCSQDRLHRAKTIDLCQNPLTKEPKLSRARKIPEWDDYDSEIASFTRNLAAEGKIHASVATADTKILAGGAAAQKPGNIAGEPDINKHSNPHDEL
ncbi:glycosyltransferase family 24 protein [Scleroderma citrinum]